MDRLRRTLSFRSRKKKRKHQTESTKPPQWQEDENKVREGTCSFQVKYLGCAEVFESRGMQVCEEAHKLLRNNNKKSHRLSFRRKKKKKSTKAVQAILYISGDSLRVVEDRAGIVNNDDGQGLIVDQTIEKVSFCAPDREHEKGFSYICRDGTTKRWMCHGFLALKESGERLSHAVGCAFAVCLEKKQQREKESVSVSFNDDKTSFSRLGSFRPATLTERLADPQSTKVVDQTATTSATAAKVEVTAKVERPQASQDLLIRQGSFREFTKLNSQTSPFKRNLSLRLNELPSNLSRQQNFTSGASGGMPHVATLPILEQDEDPAAQASSPLNHLDRDVVDIPEAVKKAESDPIAELCRQVSQGMQGIQEAPSTDLLNGTASPTPPTEYSTDGLSKLAAAAQDPTNPWAPSTQFWLPTTSTPSAVTPGSAGSTGTLASLTTATTTTNGLSTARPRPTVQSPPVIQSALFLQNNVTPSANEQTKNNNVTNGITLTPLSANQTASTNPFDTSWAVKTNNPNNPFLTSRQNPGSTANTHQQYSKEFELKM